MPAVAVDEFVSLIAQLAVRAAVDVAKLLAGLDGMDRQQQLRYVSAAYPELMAQYAAVTGEVTRVWYEEQPSLSPSFVSVAAPETPAAQYAAQARWAILQRNPLQAAQGKAEQGVFAASRSTVITNAARERVRWARHASANACGFCRMLATRGAVYRSEGLARKSHANCHCIAVPNRDGKFTPAPYVEQWRKDYQAARDGGARTPGQIANAMDRAAGGRRAPATQGGGGGGKPPTKPPTRSGAAQPSGPDPKWFRASLAHVNGLTGRYRKSVVDYTGPDHERINGWLRSGAGASDPWAGARVKDLDAVVQKNPLPTATRLTRIVSMSEGFKLTKGEDLEKIAGLQRVERGFLSTSRKAVFDMKKIADPVVLEVVAPAGTPAAAIEDLSKAKNQFEVLLGRDLPYMIVEPHWDEKNGVWRAKMIILRKESGR